MHVVTGTGELESFRPDDFTAFYRRLKARFLAAVESGAETYPYPVEHCGLCDFLSLCREQWERDDHLTLVAACRGLSSSGLLPRTSRRSRRLVSCRPGPRSPRSARRASRTFATRRSFSSTSDAPTSIASTFLGRSLGEEEVARISKELRIDLAPREPTNLDAARRG